MEKKKKKEGRFFEKGHPTYYEGKKVSADDFRAVWYAYINGVVTVKRSAELLQVSVPTCSKWFKLTMVYGFSPALPFLLWDIEDNKPKEN